MKRLALSTALLSVLVCGSRATAELLTIDPVPAATLLLPYFQVDLQAPVGDPNGPNTVFSVNNVGTTPAIARVTLWTDWGLPSLAFDLLLTGEEPSLSVVEVEIDPTGLRGDHHRPS